MSNLWLYIMLLAVHWGADFVLQTHWQASNKSKNNDALFRHVGNYTVILTAASFAIFGLGWSAFIFAWLNGCLHLATDYCTSRWTSKLMREARECEAANMPLLAGEAYHNFFVVIGLDQLIHQVTLAATIWLLLT